MPAKNPDERRQIAEIAALSRSARESGRDRMEKAHAAYRDSFNVRHECSMCDLIEIDQSLPPEEIARRGESAYRLHMRRLVLRRDQARRLTAEWGAAAAVADEKLARFGTQ